MRNSINNSNKISSKLLPIIANQVVIKLLLSITIFQLMIKNTFSVYLESFKEKSFEELGSLIEINDYYNLSIFMTSNKEIYKGIPPTKISNTTTKTNSYTSGVTYNEQYLLMACTEDYLLTKVNIETGEEKPLINYDNITMPNYTCGAFHDDNYIYISMSHIIEPEIKNETDSETNTVNLMSDFNLNESDVLNDTNLNESYYTDYLSYLLNETDIVNNSDIFFDDDYSYSYNYDYDKYSPYLQHSVLRIKLKNNIETQGPEIEENYPIDIFNLKYTTKYYWNLPSSSIFSCEIINLYGPNVVCGYIEVYGNSFYARSVVIGDKFNKTESSQSLFNLESKVSSIKLQKTNNNKIIAMVNLHCFELSLYRFYSRNRILNNEIKFFTKYESSDDLFFYNNDFLFSSTGTSNQLYIRKNISFNYFKLKAPFKNITKILGFYNELNDTLLCIYEFEHDKIVYFTLEQITFLYEFQAKQEIIKVISNTISTYNVSELIKDPTNHSSLQLESITHYIDTKQRVKKYEKYTFDNETQNLTIYESNNDWVTFDFYYEGVKDIPSSRDISYGFYIKDCKVTIRTCNFKCGSCNETFEECSSQECKQNFAVKADDSTNECFANDQNFFNYKYYNISNKFEKCYKSCKFCSLIESQSSSSSHNCIVCEDNYLKSYEHPGNCYQIDYPLNNSDYTKIVQNLEDENYTLTDSCPEEKSYKIIDTGECVTNCPETTPYYTYYFNSSLNMSMQEENFIGLLYPINSDKKIPKYKYYKGCYISCPSYTKLNNELNICECLYGWNYDEEKGDILCYDNKEYCSSPDYFYHDDTKECKLNNCNSSYYKFNFECFIEGCPAGTQSVPGDDKKCISSKNYCYINEEFKTICGDEELSEYPFRYNDTNIYLKSCNESEYYFKIKTYLYNDICYTECPEETVENNENGTCTCRYFIYYTNNKNPNYECLKETDKCSDKNKFNISDIKQCVDTKEECINLGYKVFNDECTTNCPLNSNDEDNSGICSCQYKYYENNNVLTCYNDGISCGDLGYTINMQNSNECFSTEQECINKRYKMFNNICYDSCPEKTEDKNNNGYCLCKYHYINNSNILTCYEENDTCNDHNYNYTNLDTNECFSLIDDCRNRDLKIFNQDCYSVCPRNTKENTSDISSCICSYYFFTLPNKKLNCFEQEEVCETVSEDYLYTNIDTKECFETIQTCMETGPLRVCVSNCNNIHSSTSKCNSVCDERIDYVFNDVCYKFYCPQGTSLNAEDPTNRTCICDEGSKINEQTGLTTCVYNFDDIIIPNKNNCPYFYNKQCVTKCPEDTCLNPYTEELNICVDMRPTTKKYNEICIEGINEYMQENSESENDEDIIPIVFPSGVTINAYSAEEDMEDLIEKYPNLTYVDLGDCKDTLKRVYNLSSDTKLYILGIDTPNLYGNSTINAFNYEVYLKNGTQLDINVCDKSKIMVSSSINDLDKALFNKAIEFFKEGYDIYNKSNLFYQDICSPAQDNGNDITLEDRGKYYYPQAAICNDGCTYSTVNFEQKRFICKCNSNLSEKVYIYEENETPEKEVVTEDEDQTYLEYFLSLINYKIFLCINLFFEFKSFYYNAGFYISFSILLISISLMIVFWIKGMNHVRLTLYKNIPTKDNLRELYKKQIARKNEQDLDLENNNNNITIYQKNKKKEKKEEINDKEKDNENISESKNNITNNNLINNLTKNNPPPKRENIIKLNTFIDLRRKQRELDSEEKKENEIETKNTYNNKEKDDEDNDKIISEIKSNNKDSFDDNKSNKRIIEIKRKTHNIYINNQLEDNSQINDILNKIKTKKKKKSKKLILGNSSKTLDGNTAEDNKNMESGTNNEKIEKQTISSIKLESPGNLLIKKELDTKNLINLNNENENEKEENENNNNNNDERKRKKTKSRKKKNKTYKNKIKNLFKKDTDSNNKLMHSALNTSNYEDSDLIIDLHFLRLIDRTDDDIDKREMNNIPYLQALRIEKRSFLEILISVFANEIGFLNIFCYKNPYSHFSLIISVYLFELLFDLEMNCLLYTDDVVSEKYHNDGNLSMLTSLSLSFISNIISSIAVLIIAKLTNYHDILEVMIASVKNKRKYFDNIIRLMKYIKLRLGLFYFLQLSCILIITYYLFIFCTVYHQSQVSITLNYIIGALTSLGISTGLSIIISLLRVLALYYHSNKIYNVSRYLYDHF